MFVKFLYPLQWSKSSTILWYTFYFLFRYNWLYCMHHMLISPQIIHVFNFSLWLSPVQHQHRHTETNLVRLCLQWPLIFSKPQPFKCSTMYLTLTVTTTVVTFLFTLIKGFRFCWYYLSPAPPPPGHRSTVTVSLSVYVSMSAVLYHNVLKKWLFVRWQLKPTHMQSIWKVH